MKNKILAAILCVAMALNLQAQQVIKIGIIGLDTSHATAFTKLINSGEAKEYPEFRIVAAYPYGSQTIESSYKRIPEYIETVKKYGVEITSSIQELVDKVDCVMLETNDGNRHLAQSLEVLKAGKRMFIDKPAGASLAQAIAVYELAKKYNVPVFSSSALRFVPKNIQLRNGELGKVIGADCYSPHREEPSHEDFGWYGIHGVETLFTIMGTGCVSVNRMSADDSDVVSGKWADGRIGTFRALEKGPSVYGGTAFTEKGAVPAGGYDGYLHLLKEVLNFFRTGTPPVTPEETLEIFTFMEASNISKKRNGEIVSMDEAYKAGEEKAKELLKVVGQ